jgi:hypothetical protein
MPYEADKVVVLILQAHKNVSVNQGLFKGYMTTEFVPRN